MQLERGKLARSPKSPTTVAPVSQVPVVFRHASALNEVRGLGYDLCFRRSERLLVLRIPSLHAQQEPKAAAGMLTAEDLCAETELSEPQNPMCEITASHSSNR